MNYEQLAQPWLEWEAELRAKDDLFLMIELEESEELEESDKSQGNKDKEISAYTEGEEF